MSKIVDVIGREILDSRGVPTVEAECILQDGTYAIAQVPSGTSKGEKEALELRDTSSKRYDRKGVLKAVNNINTLIRKKLVGHSVLEHKKIDEILIQLDGTSNKSKLGANAILAVSMATAKAAASYLGIPLYQYIGGIQGSIIPVPMFNLINGGAHAPNNLDIQEFMVIPAGFSSFAEGLRAVVEIYHSLKKLLGEKGLLSGIGDEGGFCPNLSSNEKALELLLESVEMAGYKLGDQIYFGLDSAASQFYKKGKYILKLENKTFSSEEIIELYSSWIKKYPIVSIEDGLAEKDWKNWKLLTQKLGEKVQLVGDDIFVTNKTLLKKGIEEGVANAILIKPNQIGTLSETLDCIEFAKRKGFGTIVSHRSGETEDTTIVHIAVGTNAGQLKTGAPCRGERIAKYNELLRIEEKLGVPYIGKAIIKG